MVWFAAVTLWKAVTILAPILKTLGIGAIFGWVAVRISDGFTVRSDNEVEVSQTETNALIDLYERHERGEINDEQLAAGINALGIVGTGNSDNFFNDVQGVIKTVVIGGVIIAALNLIPKGKK